MNLLCRERILSNEYSDWLTDYELTEELLKRNREDMDFCYRQVDDALGIAHIRRNQAESAGLLSYAYQQVPNVYGLQQNLTTAGEFHMEPLIRSGITQVQSEPLNLTGRGVVLGFVDTGIDYQNPVFRRPDGSSRILAIWDQTIQEGEPPENFYYGTEYRKEEIDRALAAEDPWAVVPSVDSNGHGTAMASIAAGSNLGEGAVFRGAAYDADIVMVKLKECKPYLREYYLLPEKAAAYQATDVIMAVEYLNSFALSFYRPVVICLGIGSSFGSHSGGGIVSRYLSRIADKRSRIVVIGGGNEGNAAHHYSGILNPATESSTFGTTNYTAPEDNRETFGNTGQTEEIEIRVGEGEKGFLAEIWGKAPNVFTLGIRSPGGETVPNTGVLEDTGREYRFVYERTEIRVNYALVEGATGDQVILLRFENPTPGIWTLLLRNDSGLPDADFHIWLPISDFLNGETYFLKPDPDITMTQPSYASSAICISAYDDRNNSIYVESGRGFSRESYTFGRPGVGSSSPMWQRRVWLFLRLCPRLGSVP